MSISTYSVQTSGRKALDKISFKSQFKSPCRGKKLPVILDTDIGGDIDDMWALGMLANSSEFDVKLVSTVSHDTEYKTKVVAKFLEGAGRSDIPVAVGTSTSNEIGAQKSWVCDYNLKDYSGIVHYDAVKAISDIVLNSDEVVTIICIGTFTNIAALVERYPGIEQKIKIVAMCGSIYKNIEGENIPIPECNIVWDVPAAQKVFGLDCDITIAPVDACKDVRLTGNDYQRVKNCNLPITKMIMDQYVNWTVCHPECKGSPEEYSSILWDTVAIHLARSEEFIEMETLGIRVDENGYTRVDPSAKKIKCALRWKDISGFKKYLVNRLIDRVASCIGLSK